MTKVFELSYEQHIGRAGSDDYNWIIAGYVLNEAQARAFVAQCPDRHQFQIVELAPDDMWMVG